ncbi:MAG: hypothetical protein H5T49_05320, partial [Hadesarchaea archaeon]|nr:hypothetical protein [Hadesarchaea archaeon]
MCSDDTSGRRAKLAEVNSGRRKRDLISTYVDILNAIGNGAKKSHIVYKANLNFTRCQRYLNDLLNMGLIKIETTPHLKWTITEKGRYFL